MPSKAQLSGTEGLGSVASGPSICDKKLIERRGKRQLSAINLDCIRPFSSTSDTLCVLSAPATHIRLQTVPCSEGFVLHKCIDIRTHEFFLYPQSISSYGQETIISNSADDIPTGENPITSLCCTTSVETNENTELLIGHTEQAKHGGVHADHTLAASQRLSDTVIDHPLSRIAPSSDHSACSPQNSTDNSPRRASNCCSAAACRRPDFDSVKTAAGCSGASSTQLRPTCGGEEPSRKAGRRSRSPGTPRNVDSVAWFVGAGLTGATIRPPSRRRRRHAEAAPAPQASAPAAETAHAVSTSAAGAAEG
jgi:hypothetical protein